MGGVGGSNTQIKRKGQRLGAVPFDLVIFRRKKKNRTESTDTEKKNYHFSKLDHGIESVFKIYIFFLVRFVSYVSGIRMQVILSIQVTFGTGV